MIPLRKFWQRSGLHRLKPSTSALLPIHFLLVLIASVFVAETLAMFLLTLLPPLSVPVEAVVDATLLVWMILPMLYLFSYRPLALHIDELLTYQERLQSLISELSLTEERERHRLAIDLHDSIGQLLAFTKLKIAALHSAAPSADLAKGLDDVHGLIIEVIQNTRSLTFDLSPPVLYLFGLEAAMESLVERLQEQHGLDIVLTDDTQPKPLSENVRGLLFRAVRELLLNVVKHARARQAWVTLRRDGETIRITVVDDGVGFDTAKLDVRTSSASRFGLFSIADRLQHFGGGCTIASTPGQGTQATLMAPLQEAGEQ